jgi:peptidoglycan/LPS O-acetylase OafA/YrhL
MVSVCFFFIVSGWSLTYNFYNKKDYLRGFLKSKALKLVMFALVCEVVGRVLRVVFLNDGFTIDISLITSWNWYIYETVVYYIAFYVVYKSFYDKSERVILMGVISLLVSVFTWYMSNSFDTFWTHAFHFSSLCFWFGIILHEYYNQLVKFISHKFLSTLCLLVCGLASCVCLKMPQGDFFGGIFLHNLVGICVMYVVAIWAHYIDYTKLPLVGFLTKYSAEIYLYQFMMLTIVMEIFVKNGWAINIIYVVCVVICTIMIAVPMHYVDLKIK